MTLSFSNNLFSKILLVIMMTFSATVFAADLTQAKEDGLIGERYDGYIGIVKAVSADVKALVKETNQKRKEKYQEIAIDRQLPLNKIEIIAGEAAINKTLPGNYIMISEGQWEKK